MLKQFKTIKKIILNESNFQKISKLSEQTLLAFQNNQAAVTLLTLFHFFTVPSHFFSL